MTTAFEAVRHGIAVGAGAALNVSVGFIPRRVDIYNMTDGTVEATAYLDKMIAFNTGTVAPAPNALVTDLTSGATGRVKDYILTSGTFAGGNAAGFLIVDADTIVGTFGVHNLTFNNDPTAGNASVAATAAPVEHCQYTSGTAGPVSGTGNTGITSYVGDSTHAKGFTVGSTIAASGKLLRWTAFRGN